jgi:hypothetical protein
MPDVESTLIAFQVIVMNLRISRLLLLTLAIALSGCGYTSKPTPPAVKPGASLQINRGFDALPNGSYIYFQNGANLPRRQLDKWSAYCALYVYNSEFGADYVTSVQPGRFQVSRSLNGREVVDSRDQNLSDTKLAGLVSWPGYDPPSYILYHTRLYLWSADQPDVKNLTCFQRAGNYGDYYPRFEQMKAALGDLIQINR